MKYLDYLAANETAYLEYHAWRGETPPDIETFTKTGISSQMTCDLCREIEKRRDYGWAKRTIKSVASWWWLGTRFYSLLN